MPVINYTDITLKTFVKLILLLSGGDDGASRNLLQWAVGLQQRRRGRSVLSLLG